MITLNDLCSYFKVDLDVDQSELSKIHKKLLLIVHPDKGGSNNAYLKLQWYY